MYQHKCEAAKSADYPKGILIHGKVEVNLRPTFDERTFWMEGWDDVMDEAEGLRLYCLDCEEPFGEVIKGQNVRSVESMLQEGELAQVEWVEGGR
jgi:hypothetical protein